MLFLAVRNPQLFQQRLWYALPPLPPDLLSLVQVFWPFRALCKTKLPALTILPKRLLLLPVRLPNPSPFKSFPLFSPLPSSSWGKKTKTIAATPSPRVPWLWRRHCSGVCYYSNELLTGYQQLHFQCTLSCSFVQGPRCVWDGKRSI